MIDARFETAVINAVREPLLVLDRDMNVVMANSAFYKGFGLRPPQVLTLALTSIAEAAWNYGPLVDRISRLLSDGRPFKDLELEAEFEGVGRLSLQINGDLIPMSSDRGVLVLLAIEDVTLRRQAERAAALIASELARSNAALEQFASVASHDLQEPLRKIIAFSGLLTEDCAAQLDDQARDYLTRITNSAGRMQGLINDVLQFSRLKRMKPVPQNVDLRQSVSEALIDLEDRMHATGASVDMDGLPSVLGDPTQLRLVFQNLLGNALKFRREGVPPLVRVVGARVAASGEDMVDIVVEDNGIGFEERFAEQIFSPFQRLHSRKAYEGTGMGLAIVKEIVHAHGGRIVVTSKPGEGSRFIITLPAATSAAA